MARYTPQQSGVAITTEVQARLRAVFSEADPHGGKIPAERVQLRPGVEIALDGFSDSMTEEECEGLIWVSPVRWFSSREFPAEAGGPLGGCGLPTVMVLQIGVARCSQAMDDYGNPPPAERMDFEGIRSIDDAARLDRALCDASGALEELGLLNGYYADAAEPIGPGGGVVAWTRQTYWQLA